MIGSKRKGRYHVWTRKREPCVHLQVNVVLYLHGTSDYRDYPRPPIGPALSLSPASVRHSLPNVPRCSSELWRDGKYRKSAAPPLVPLAVCNPFAPIAGKCPAFPRGCPELQCRCLLLMGIHYVHTQPASTHPHTDLYIPLRFTAGLKLPRYVLLFTNRFARGHRAE